MPRNASQVYAVPVGTDGTPNTIIFSGKYNTFIHDVETDLNTPRPVIAGGTGSTSADGALVNLSGEKAAQLVTNWDSTVWMPGSFYAATTASGAAPVAGHAFAGVVVINEPLVSPPTNQNVVVEARDMTDPAHLTYYRIMAAGVWGPWLTARQSIYAAPFDALAYNGMQTNGSMDVSQEFGTTGSNLTGTAKYMIDGWMFAASGPHVMNCLQDNGNFPPGYINCLHMGTVTANPAPAASDYCSFLQRIEGYRISRLAWGTANAQPITVGFWVMTNKTGNYSAAINSAASGIVSYVFSFTMNSANTWEYKVATIPGPTSGTWGKGNVTSFVLFITMMAGSSLQTTPGSWASGTFVGAPGAVNGVAAVNDYMLVTGVVILPGIEAPSAARSPLIMRPFDQELLACKRYYAKFSSNARLYATASGVLFDTPLFFPVEMRATPTLTLGTPALSSNFSGSSGAFSQDRFSGRMELISVAAGDMYAFGAPITADARL